MTVLKTSPINNMSVSAALDPLPFKARLKLYVSFLEKNNQLNFFIFLESLSLSQYTACLNLMSNNTCYNMVSLAAIMTSST